MQRSNRRKFIKHTLTASIGMGLPGAANILLDKIPAKGGRIGMIGLDTGHSPAFVKTLNSATNGDYDGFKVVAAYPPGTDNIIKWKKRIPEFTAKVKEYGVEIVHSIPDLLKKVDYIILTTIDGNKHLEQARPVFEAGLPVFIDKPFAGSIEDARKIANLARLHNTPMFSSSSLRFMEGAERSRALDGQRVFLNSI